jgi:hypothetical protein
VYLYEHLHPEEDCEEDVTPSPLVTFSARLEEAIALSDDITSSETLRPFSPVGNKSSSASSSSSLSLSSLVLSVGRKVLDKIFTLLGQTPPVLPHPLYRRMSIVCFDPYNPANFSGGVDSSAVDPHASLTFSGVCEFSNDITTHNAEYAGSSEEDGYMHLRNSHTHSPTPTASAAACQEPPIALSRSKTDPGIYSHQKPRDFPLAPAGGEHADSHSNLVVRRAVGMTSTGLRKRAMVSISGKPFADSVDISTGGGVDFSGRGDSDSVPGDVHKQDAYDNIYYSQQHSRMESE